VLAGRCWHYFGGNETSPASWPGLFWIVQRFAAAIGSKVLRNLLDFLNVRLPLQGLDDVDHRH
jgi:hypothetical protein